MIIRLLIKTPAGQATGLKKKMSNFYLPKKVKTLNTFVNDDDSEFAWEIDTDYRRVKQIEKKVAVFEKLAASFIGNRMARKSMEKLVSPEQRGLIEDMIKKDTSLTVIRLSDPSPDEMMSMWDHIKKRFKKGN